MRILILLFLTISLSLAEPTIQEEIEANKKIEILNKLIQEHKELELKLNHNNIWLKKYGNYLVYKKIESSLYAIEKEIKKISRKRDRKSKDRLIFLKNSKITKINELELLSEYKDSHFGDLTKAFTIDKAPAVVNPIAVISAISYIKQLKHQSDVLISHKKDLEVTVELLASKKELMTKIYNKQKELDLSPTIKEKDIEMMAKQYNDFYIVSQSYNTTVNVYNKKVDEITLDLTSQIKSQGVKAFYIGISILILLIISFGIKALVKKYIKDNERFYTANKALNITTFVIIVLILLFAYLENVSYLVTVLGFASAGFAIAMKDWFMSILGWFVMIVGGSIHVGDRIKARKDGQEFVGDVLDISPLRITLQEDVTLTSYMLNRRAGRIIFIPNNYIFHSIISNYSHSGLKTVWDGIDITITFDSNHKKALHITKEIAKKYSKGYTDITRKQLNMLRNKYNLRNTNVEPRIFNFIEPNGMRVSVWYQTNAYATLTLRSTISSEIIEAFQKEDDIKIAYPTQNINLGTQNTDVDINSIGLNL
jgi:small-conductance mechanosensitive channel